MPNKNTLLLKSKVKPKVKTKAADVTTGFENLWGDLFSKPTHLDSLLSKQTPKLKSILAQIVPTILLRPVSEAQALGIGILPDEPWNLDSKARGRWRPAQLLAERLYQGMIHGIPEVDPMEEDFPLEMREEWNRCWGKDSKVVSDLVDALGRLPPLSLRASRKVDPKALMKGLKEKGHLPVAIKLSEVSPLGVRLSGYAPVLQSEWYEKGAFEIQDEGSQLMSLFALWPERYGYLLKSTPGPLGSPGQALPTLPEETPVLNVIDACAGAGGKSLALADILKGKGRVYAYDTSKVKLQALRRRATLAGLNNIQTVPLVEGEEAQVIDKFQKSAHVVLVDAPCSGWGVLRRNPDIKWRQTSESLTRMPQIQKRLLSLYSKLVGPDGRLVYGVCTFRTAETTDIVEQFVAENPDFEIQEGGYLGPGPSDGFFMQSFRRKA